MIRTILGHAGAGKTGLVFSEIAEYVRKGEGRTVLLVPEQYSHEAERALCAAAGDTMCRYAEVNSFSYLARRVLAETGHTGPIMDAGGKLLCMAVAAENLEGKLKVYANGRMEPGTLDSLTQAVERLKNNGITSEKLMEAAGQTTGLLRAKLKDLSLLLEAYITAQSRSGADSADQLEMLAELLQEHSIGRRVYADGFSDFSVLQKKVLRQLVQSGTDLIVCLTCGREEDNAFLLARSTARWLKEMAQECEVPYEEQWMETTKQGNAIDYYCENLFDFSARVYTGRSDQVETCQANDISEECELAAARMAALARSGFRWRDMAVAVRGFREYRTALESACARYGVPLFTSGREDTLQKNVPTVISSALECVCRGYEYESMFALLKTGLGPITLEQVDALENYVLLWDIRGSLWARPWKMHPDGYNQTMDDKAQKRLEELNSLREKVITPLKALERRTGKAATASEQAQALADFLEEISLAERLDERAAELEQEGRLETAASCARLWNILCTALEQFAAVLGDMPMDAERFQGLFILMLSKYNASVIPVSLDSVNAGEIDAMRRRHTKALLLLGAVEGRIPAPQSTNGVFTEDERDELTRLGLDVGDVEQDLSREMERIYNCLSLPSDYLYMSWPSVDSRGEDCRASLLIDRAEKLLAVSPVREDAAWYRTYAREPALSLAIQGERGNTGALFLAAREYFRSQGMGPELERMATAVNAPLTSLAPESVRSLYGPQAKLSPSRAERFVDCRFSYFLEYGLKAKPRLDSTFAARDYGTFVHYVLESVVRDIMEMGGFSTVTEQQALDLADQYMDRYIREEMQDFTDKTARFAYLFSRLRSTVRRIVREVWEELRTSQFQPLDLELDLTAEGVLAPAQGEGPVLTGRADRVDGWKKDGTLYLRITDYKTGRKKFELSDICQGFNMQMLLYLFALQSRAQEYYGVQEIRPAGVLYSMARFDIINTKGEMTDEELEDFRRNSSQRSGILLDEEEVLNAMEPGENKRFLPVKKNKNGKFVSTANGALASQEKMHHLSCFIDRTMMELANELQAGSVAINPWYTSSNANACRYCDYRQVCLFDETSDSWREREKFSDEEAWGLIDTYE